MDRYTVYMHCTNCADEWPFDSQIYISEEQESEEDSIKNIINKYENSVHNCCGLNGKHFGLIKIDEIIKDMQYV